MTIINLELYQNCLSHYSKVSDHDFVVSNSIPIPYFGDLAAYQASPLRILTAALNPSDSEFKKTRFDVHSGLNGPTELETELSAYFNNEPYRRWFRSFELVLSGLDASYGGKMVEGNFCSTALHVDLCSPIATNPTWSKLLPKQRDILTTSGREIFEQLVDELEPNIIIASLSWKHIEKWHSDFQSGREWDRIIEHSTTAKGVRLRAPLLVQYKTMSTRKDHPHLFVNATAAHMPFGWFTSERKLDAGQKLRELFKEIRSQVDDA